MKKAMVVAFLALSAVAAFAASWSGSFRFSPSSVKLTDVARDGHRFQLVEPVQGQSPAGLAALVTSEPGKPALPQWLLTLVIPQGMKVAGIECEARAATELARAIQVFPGQPPVPISRTVLPGFVAPDPLVYGSDAAFPGKYATVSPVGSKSGFRLVTITLNPVRYFPVSGKLEIAGQLAVTVRYEPDPEARPRFLTAAQAASFSPAVRALVYNPRDVDRYAPGRRVTDFGDLDCVIITSDALSASFQPLVDWRTKKGFKTEIRTVAWIVSNYSGRDTPERIRNFIIDYYTNQGLRWVILGGDSAVVPPRLARAYCGGETGNIPADVYYGDIEWSWDGNNNNIFGEPLSDGDTVDLFYDLYVGRASVDNTTQVQTFVNKVLGHEQNPPTDYLRRILLADALLWTGYNHQQSNDSIANITPSGWTDVHIHSPGTTTAVRDSINNGFQFCHLVGHGNENGIYDGNAPYYSVYYANTQTNGAKLNLMNSIACQSGNFEWSDCCAEAAHNKNGGASIAVIMNSRYGWGTPPYLGPSEKLDIRFYDFFFNHDTMPIGITHALSKEVYRALAISQGVWRWCYYELNLLGDPLLLMYENVPVQLTESFLGPIGTGPQSFTVTVTSADAPVENALVCVYKGAEVYARNYTNGSGQVTFSVNPTTSGYMYVTSTRANYLPAIDSCEVIAGISRDVGVMRIVAPAGTIDSGATVTPQAWVRNHGTVTATFPVKLGIGTGYTNTQDVTDLAGGDSLLVEFDDWTAAARGTVVARCSTGFTGDQYFPNDTLSSSFTVRVVNVGVRAILAPTGSIDSGVMTTPRARVKNFGTAPASFPVALTIGSVYADTQNVSNLGPGDSLTVNFVNWVPTQPGNYGTRCTTALAGDMVPANDLLTGSVTVRVRNVGVLRILVPSGDYDSGAQVTPQVRVRNYGSGAATFPVTFRIGAIYANTRTVSNLAPGDSSTVSFAVWNAGTRGTFRTRCSTALPGDQIRTNDTMSGSVTIRVLNVGTVRIIQPSGSYDSGVALPPQARVKNYGTGPATFPVVFRIGAFYADTQNVTSLAPGDSQLVNFTLWNALQRGTHTTRCTTALAGDILPGNDAASGTVTVRVPGDVGVSRIIAPTGTLDSGTLVQPQAVAWNFGATPASFPITLRIGAAYANTRNVDDLAPGDSQVVSFADWNALRRGTYATGCTTALSGDTVAGNNGVSDSVTVQVMDIAVTAINTPSGTYEPGRVIVPAATVRNYGSAPADFDIWMFISDPTGALAYSANSSGSGLAPGASVMVNSFPVCTLKLLGDWSAKCSTAMTGDVRPGNNVLERGFRVRSQWLETQPLPESPSGQRIKHGAWLAYHSANGLLYAAKASRTGDFYSYNPHNGAWTQLHSIPYGHEGKLPRKGACGASDGARYIYAAKGSNTLGFWHYDVEADSWLQLADVPGGANNVKPGAAAVFAQLGGIDYVYLLKGGGTEFYRYSTETGIWRTMSEAPRGASPKWESGSFLVYDGDQTIYAHKAKYHSLWTYDVAADTWSSRSLPGMPYVGRAGRSRKSRDGGAGAWAGGVIYALKGGNTNEFWAYVAQAGNWLELDTLPSRGITGRPRRVGGGGAMANAAGTLFALKGGKTCELWRFSPGYATSPQPEREGIMAERLNLNDGQMRIEPNPLSSGFAIVRLASPLRSPATLRIYDAMGRCLQSATYHPPSAMQLDLRSLPAGVYLVRLESGGARSSQKLVVQR